MDYLSPIFIFSLIKHKGKNMLRLILITLILFFMVTNMNNLYAQEKLPEWMNTAIKKIEKEFNRYHSNTDDLVRLDLGLNQVSKYWREEDGNAEEFESFVKANFIYKPEELDELFNRCNYLLEQIDGHMQEISRELRQQVDLEMGTVLEFDKIIAGYDPSAHITDDFFKNKIALIVLLNFTAPSLEQRINEGQNWDRRKWAETRLAQRFLRRVPSEVNQQIAQAASEADQYISEYNIWMHHLVDNNGQRLFPEGMKLLSHWNLRDQIKADYNDKEGFERQKMIMKVMERIVDQTIPQIVINNPAVDWNPFTNEVKKSTVKDYTTALEQPGKTDNTPEADIRYKQLLNTFLASKKADPYSPMAPTLIARRFEINREIPEARIKSMFEQVLSSPLIPKIASLIEHRLGRKLHPFDIWYNGFREKTTLGQTELDKIVSSKYPDAKAFEKDIPVILEKLGFPKQRAEVIAQNIVVDPARGSGHAMGAAMKTAKAHLRTRVGKNGMDYKGFNIAVHELGHNVEQTISLNNIDYYLLNGVPNTAFTEAFAFVFQARDLELLGVKSQDPEAEHMKALNDLWATYEIAGVALVDMEVWHWMYEHPDATPAELKAAVMDISKKMWNRFYAPVFGDKDVTLLAIYSHMIDAMLYLPDYPLGHLIAFQIEEYMQDKVSIGAEFERMAKIGSIAPDVWMKTATGSQIGPEALLKAAEEALGIIN